MIIACTGHTEQDFIIKAWRHGFDELIPKPCNFEVFKQIINEIVEKEDVIKYTAVK